MIVAFRSLRLRVRFVCARVTRKIKLVLASMRAMRAIFILGNSYRGHDYQSISGLTV